MPDQRKFTLALVTGASSGIGAAMCRLLAKHGIDLVISGRNQDRLHHLATELAKSVHVTEIIADLECPYGRSLIVDAIWDKVPDLIINSAGFGLYGQATSYTTQEQLNIVNTNVLALLELTLEGGKAMVQAKKPGVILNISSAADRLIFPNFSVYAASKAFVSQVSRSIDYELSPKGVRVLVACPGMVDTEFRKRSSQGTVQWKSWMSMNVDFVADQLWKQIIQGKKIHTFDWKTRIGTFIVKWFPEKWITRLLSQSISQ